MKLKAKLDRLRKAVPKGPTKYGQLYAVADETKKRYKSVTLHTLFISEENTHLLRPHVFQKDDGMTPQEWHAWFSAKVNAKDGRTTPPLTVERLYYIHTKNVLGGLAIRTNKSWAVERILGWTGNNAKHKLDTPAIRRKRHQTKRQRRKNG